MALILNDYKNARAAPGTSYATVYTCPADTKALVVFAQAANVDGSVSADVSLQWLDASASDVATNLVDSFAVPPKCADSVISGPAPLEPGDQLQVKASAEGDIHITFGIAEMVAA